MRKKVLGIGVVIFLFAAIVGVAIASATSFLKPISDGFYLQWQTSTASTTHYTNVDEPPPCNGTTDYNFTTTVGNRDSYGVDLSGIPNNATITQFQVVPCASKHNDTGSSTMNVFYRFDGVNGSGAGNYQLTGTTPVVLATTTFSGLSLTKTASSTLEVGAVLATSTATSTGARLGAIRIKVFYNP